MIKAGEIIVSEGQIITNEIYEQLNLVGLLDGQRNIFPVFGLILLLLIVSGIMAFEFNKITQNKLFDNRILLGIFLLASL